MAIREKFIKKLLIVRIRVFRSFNTGTGMMQLLPFLRMVRISPTRPTRLTTKRILLVVLPKGIREEPSARKRLIAPRKTLREIVPLRSKEPVSTANSAASSLVTFTPAMPSNALTRAMIQMIWQTILQPSISIITPETIGPIKVPRLFMVTTKPRYFAAVFWS